MPDTRTVAAKRIRDGAGQILLFRANHLTSGAKARVDDANGSSTSSFTGHAVAASHKTRFNALPSAAGGISRLVTARLRTAGVAPKPLLAKAGLTLAQIDDHN